MAAATSSGARASGELEQALHLGRRALEVACQTEDRPLQVAARFVLAMSENNAGNFRRSLEHLTPLLSIDDPGAGWNEAFVIDRPQAATALIRYWMVFSCVQLGEFGRALHLIEEGLRELNAENDVLGAQTLILHISHGKLLNGAGNFEAAVQAYDIAFRVYRDDCLGNFYSPLAWGRGLAYALAGRVRESLQQFEDAAAVATRRGTRVFAGMWLLHFGRALLEAGRLDEAARMAGDALTLTSKNGDRPAEAGALGLLGEVAMRRNPVAVEEMESYLLQSLALAEPLEMRPLAARCHLRLAWLYAKTDRAEMAYQHEAAESLLDQMGRPLSLEAAGLH